MQNNTIYTGNILSIVNNKLQMQLMNNDPYHIFQDESLKVSFFYNNLFKIDYVSFLTINNFLRKSFEDILLIIKEEDTDKQKLLKINKYLINTFLLYRKLDLGDKNLNIYYMIKYILDFLYEASFMLPNEEVFIKNKNIIYIDREINIKLISISGYDNNIYIILNEHNLDLFFNDKVTSSLNIFLESKNIKLINEDVFLKKEFNHLNLSDNYDTFIKFQKKLTTLILNR